MSYRDYLPIVQTFIGGLLALSGGLTSGLIMQSRLRRSERRSLTLAFYGEIKAILKIIERRQYDRAISLTVRGIKKGKRLTLVIKVTRNYFRVYDENVGKIGVLPIPLPEKIVSFYIYMTSILEDIALLNEPSFYDNGDDGDSISILSNMRDNLQSASELGQEVCREIERIELVLSKKSTMQN